MDDKQGLVVIDAGKQRSKRVKQLKRGDGPLAAEVARVIASHGPNAVPVVVLYEQKAKTRSRRLGLIPLLGM